MAAAREAISALTPNFAQSPAGLSKLMQGLVKAYRRHALAADATPDRTLLEPVERLLEHLEANDAWNPDNQ